MSLLGLGLPPLSNLAGPVQHLKGAILEAWRDKVSSNLCCRKGFRGGPLLDVHGSLQLLTSSHVPGTVFFLVVFVVRLFHVGFVGHLMVMVIYFGNVPFLLLLRFVNILSSMISSEWIRDIGLVVYSGTVGFLVSLVSMEPPLGLLMLLIVPVIWLNLRLAGILLVFLLRGALLLILMLLRLPLCFLIILMSGLMVALFLIRLLVSSAGAGFFAHQPASCWDHRCWGSCGFGWPGW